jgi:hypothetical protein
MEIDVKASVLHASRIEGDLDNLFDRTRIRQWLKSAEDHLYQKGHSPFHDFNAVALMPSWPAHIEASQIVPARYAFAHVEFIEDGFIGFVHTNSSRHLFQHLDYATWRVHAAECSILNLISWLVWSSLAKWQQDGIPYPLQCPEVQSHVYLVTLIDALFFELCNRSGNDLPKDRFSHTLSVFADHLAKEHINPAFIAGEFFQTSLQALELHTMGTDISNPMKMAREHALASLWLGRSAYDSTCVAWQSFKQGVQLGQIT